MNEIEPALRRAYALGQKYWQQADSDSDRDHRKADETQAKFNQLVESMQGWLSPAEADNLRTQLAEAQKDSDRLDWIEQNANMGVAINRLKHITDLSRLVYEVAVDDVYATEDTLRAAIDAAKGGSNA